LFVKFSAAALICKIYTNGFDILQTQLAEPFGGSYDNEILDALRDDSEDNFEVFSEDEDDDFYERILDIGQSSGREVDYSDDHDQMLDAGQSSGTKVDRSDDAF
jgi:hypothetical protein